MIALHNAKIITFYPPSVSDEQDIIIDHEQIIDTGKDIITRYKPDTIYDLTGKYISPGLVCSHNHFYSFLSRGILADIKPSKNFTEILENMWWKLDRALDEDAIYFSAITAAMEAIKCGTTAVIDHHSSPSVIEGSLSIIRSALEKAGLRGILAYEVTDRNGENDSRLTMNESFAVFNAEKESSLIKGAVGAHASFTLSDKNLELLKHVLIFTEKGLHIHAAEDKYDQEHSKKTYGKSVMKRFADADLLNEKAIIAHGVYLEKKDIDILNNYDAFLVHNPRSNMNNNVGYFNKLDKIKNPALGTDGIGSDMFEELKFAYFRNREAKNKYDLDLFLKALQNGNLILERYFEKPFGKIEKGYTADIVIYAYNPPTPLQGENLAGHLIFGAMSKDIETVIINGKVVYKKHSFPFDTREIYSSAASSASRLWNRMNEL